MIASSYHAETADMTLTIGKINAILLRVSEQITAADGKKVVTDDQKKEDSLIPPSAALLPPPSKLRERLAIAHREVDLLRRLIRIAESGRPYPHPTSDHGETSI